MNIKKIITNTVFTVALPIAMFLLMMTLTRAKGITYYGSFNMWRTIFNNLGLSIPIALGIGMQLRYGRMDFSGGVTMFLSGFAGVLIAQKFGNSAIIMLSASVLCGLIISMITASVYTIARLPIIICSVTLTLLYESVTLIIGKGDGANIMDDTSLNVFGHMPVALIIMIIAIVIYYFVTTYTISARQSTLLANGQQIAVNIGINEKKNVYFSYVFSGIIFGLAGAVYATQHVIIPQTNLSTASIMFSYIVPVYIGFFIGKLSTEVIGIFVGSITIQIMNYGLNALGYGGGGWNNILFGFFMMSFWILIAKIDDIKKLYKHLRHSKKNIPKTENI